MSYTENEISEPKSYDWRPKHMHGQPENNGHPACGCYMHIGANFQEWLFCPVHAAAPQMYEALEDAPEPAEWLDSITASHIFFEKWFIDYRKWYSTHRRPALAKAEGRE